MAPGTSQETLRHNSAESTRFSLFTIHYSFSPVFSLHLLKKSEYRMRLGIKNEQVHFILLSAFTIFARKSEYRMRLNNL